MRRLIPVLLPLALFATSCSTSSYDLGVTTASVPPRFEDKDPQDFGARNPHRHQVHGIDVSKWNGDIDSHSIMLGVSMKF